MIMRLVYEDKTKMLWDELITIDPVSGMGTSVATITWHRHE